jgi:hypothetical protein
MIKRRITALTFSLTAATLAGCGHAPVAPTTPAAAAAAPAVTSPDGILALSKRLTANRRALYSLTSNRYSYYVGGVLLAEYEAGTHILRLSSLRPDQSKLVCEYTPQGDLFVDSAAHPDKNTYTTDCERLAQGLSADLAR